MRLFAIMLKGRLLDEIESRISDLSEPQLDAWLKGHISLVDAVLERHGDGGSPRVLGDPTEGALLVAAAKAGFDLAALAAAHPRDAELPFDS